MTIADRVLNHPWFVAAFEDERVAAVLPALQVAWLLLTMPIVIVQVALHGKIIPDRPAPT